MPKHVLKKLPKPKKNKPKLLVFRQKAIPRISRKKK